MPNRFTPSALVIAAVTAIFALLPASVAAQDEPRHVLAHDGIDRTYLITVPPAVLAAGEPVPLVIILHGGGGNAANAVAMTGFDAKAVEEGFIAVFPDGTGRTMLRTWNAGHCCGYAMENDIDDVGFIAALIDELAATYPVDTDRVYVTGMSNGAMMTHRLGIELSDRIAAIAPVVGGLFGDEPAPPNAVAALIINGRLDRMIPVGGGFSEGRFPDAWDGTPLMPAAYQASFWAAANGCDAQAPAPVDDPVYELTAYTCPEGAAVEYYLILEGGHAWPGGTAGTRLADVPVTDFDATDVMWAFFERQSLPSPAGTEVRRRTP